MKKILLTISLGVLIIYLPYFLDIEKLMTSTQLIVLKLLIIMILLWVTEIIPPSITALFPILVLPFLSDVEPKSILSSYSSSVVFLILGGFIIAYGFQKSNLHYRLALGILSKFGDTKLKVMVSISLLTTILSMLFSNTATTLLMLPIVKSIIDENFRNDKLNSSFTNFLLLTIAYSASIGGMMTPIGTIPNAVLIGFLSENYSLEIDLKKWFVYVSPVALSIIIVMLTFISLRVKEINQKISTNNIANKYLKLGRYSKNERVATLIIILTILLWIFKSNINLLLNIKLTDSIIAIFGASLFFLIPAKNGKVMLTNEWFKKIPWNILILFGGGLALASLIISSGLAKQITLFLNDFQHLNLFTLILLIAFFTSILTEFTSNTATTFLLLPILSIFADTNQIELTLLLLPFILSASCAFMMPIATPPNAIIYSNNSFKIFFMVKNGFFLNLMAILIIASYVYLTGGIF